MGCAYGAPALQFLLRLQISKARTIYWYLCCPLMYNPPHLMTFTRLLDTTFSSSHLTRSYWPKIGIWLIAYKGSLVLYYGSVISDVVNRIDLLRVLREEVAPHPALDTRLALCERSPDTPPWWQPARHDKLLVLGVCK